MTVYIERKAQQQSLRGLCKQRAAGSALGKFASGSGEGSLDELALAGAVGRESMSHLRRITPAKRGDAGWNIHGVPHQSAPFKLVEYMANSIAIVSEPRTEFTALFIDGRVSSSVRRKSASRNAIAC